MERDPKAPKKKYVQARWQAWKPQQPGEEMEGHFIRLSTADGLHGTYEVAQFRTLDGRHMSCSGVVLVGLLREFNVAEGDEVKFVYQGMVPSKNNGGSYASYELWLTEFNVPRVPTEKKLADAEFVGEEWDHMGEKR